MVENTEMQPFIIILKVPKTAEEKIYVCKLEEIFLPSYIIIYIENSKTTYRVDLDVVAQYEPLHPDLPCLHIQLFSFFAL